MIIILCNTYYNRVLNYIVQMTQTQNTKKKKLSSLIYKIRNFVKLVSNE